MSDIGVRGLPSVLLLLIGLITANSACAGDLVSAQAFFEDSSGKIPFAEIPRQEFKPFNGVFSGGYSASIFWFRLTIDPSLARHPTSIAGTDKLILRIRPPYLREVEFFDPSYPTHTRRLSGDLYAASGDEYHSFSLTFAMPSDPGPRQVYVRLKTSSSTLIKFDAYTIEEFSGVEFRQGILFSLYIFYLLLSLLLALFLLFISRNGLIMVFALRQFFAILWALAIYGIYRYAELSVAPRPVYFLVGAVLCVVLVSEIFDYLLFRTFRVPRVFSRVQLLLMATPILGFGFVLFGDIRSSMISAMAGAICFSFTSMVAAYFIFPATTGERGSAELPKWVIAASYTLIFSFLVMTTFPQLGLYTGSEFAVYSVAFHTVLSTTLVSIIIALRAKRFHDEKLLLNNQLISAQSALRTEVAAREDQSALLAMLSHEIKTPLAAMKMMLGSLPARDGGYEQMNNAIAEMNTLVDRCLYVGKIEEGVIITNTSPVDVGDALHERLLSAGAGDRMQVSIAENLVKNTDPQLLGIILANLIDNALKYSAPDAPIRIIATGNSVAGLEISFSNKPRLGRWPDPESLFKKYYRAATSHNVIGSGLGLFLSQQLAEHLGGGIAYEPTETEVRFRLWLPS